MLTYLDYTVTQNEWLADGRFTMADTAIVVQLLALKKAGVSIDAWKNLKRYIERVIQQPSFSGVLN
jgi:glutathione S-transferase